MKGNGFNQSTRGNSDRHIPVSRQDSFDRALEKPKRTIICSSPYTSRAAQSLIAFDKLMGRIQDDFAMQRINGAQFMQAGQRADALIRSFESEINNIRNQFRQRLRPNRPQQKPPRVHQSAPAGASVQNAAKATNVVVAQKQTTQPSASATASKPEEKAAKTPRLKKKVASA